VSTRRKVLKDFHFSDGQTVKSGDWVCTAPKGMNTDPDNYVKAQSFMGFRFVKPEDLEQAEKVLPALSSQDERFAIPEMGRASNYIELSDWQQWGTGRCAW
jgi:cytochrome P450